MKFFSLALLLSLGALLFLSSSPTVPPAAPVSVEPAAETAIKIKWVTWQEAIRLNKKHPRKIMVDLYTDWCGWCKKMDKSTFVDPVVVNYVNENFYAVKFDAEQRGTLQYRGHSFQFKSDAGRRGAHELAIALLDGRMSYPSMVYLDEKQDRIAISPGFKPGDQLMIELRFAAQNHYKVQEFAAYKASLSRD